jgi:chorismate mutase
VQLEEVRGKVKEIDDKILDCIVQRTNLAEKVWEIKKTQGGDIIDKKQNKIVLDRAMKRAIEDGLDAERVKRIFEILIEMNVDRQYQIDNDDV